MAFSSQLKSGHGYGVRGWVSRKAPKLGIFDLDKVNLKISIFRVFNKKSLSSDSYVHIINEIQNLTNPANNGLLRPHQGHKKRGRYRKNLPVAGVLR